MKEEELRLKFEAIAGPDSYGFKRSRRGTYQNPAKARDWRMFLQGATLAEPAEAKPMQASGMVPGLAMVSLERLAQWRTWANNVAAWTRQADRSSEAARLKASISSAMLTAVPPDDKALPVSEGAPFGIIDPDYSKAYTIARIVAWQYGYALCLHGSFTRDLDLVAVPWTGHACPPEHLVQQIEFRSGLKRQGDPSAKPHGRLAWSLLFPGFEDPRWVDLSVLPPRPPGAIEGDA